MDLFRDMRSYLAKPKIRPWALCAPILVLLICLPLLRPVRHPALEQISDDELARLATIQALAEQHTQAIERTQFAPAHHTIQARDHLYSQQPATMAAVLAMPYALMHRFGLTFEKNQILVTYLLTLLGVTLPVAGAAGLIYRMGRLFELPRPKRAFLAVAVVLGSGFISYAVVLNSHAPAAALVIASATCLVHVAISWRPRRTRGWLVVGGFCAALAAAIEPSAIVFLPLFALVILAMRWRKWARVWGLGLFVLGILPPLALHVALTMPITGDVRPGSMHPELSTGLHAANDSLEDDDVLSNSKIAALVRGITQLCDGIGGDHGLLSHFPVIIIAFVGIGAVMRRNWPMTSKLLAGATLAGAITIFTGYCLTSPSGGGSMFAGQWFIIFVPLLLVWAGAWLRRGHHPATWTFAGALLVFSIAVSLIGATDPFPRTGYDHYTAAAAAKNLLHPKQTVEPPAILARQ